jgi:UDP-N-acetylmuramyl pentapeptide phosphotransferase/UDP-N-acetylglucosamine-1-phosphate transferase
MVILVMPSILQVAKGKNLFYQKVDNSNQSRMIPLGGIAVFIGLMLGSILGTVNQSFNEIKYILAALLLVFFVGLKNDLIQINIIKKLIVQFVAAFVLVVLGGVRLTHFPFSLDIIEFGKLTSYVISIFLVMFTINAYIFMNKIKGLVSIFGIVAGITFGVWFFSYNKMQCSAIAFALAGSLLAQLIYTEISKRRATQVGETGAKIAGLIIISLAYKLNQFGINESSINYNPTLVFAVMAIPLIDATRVVFWRIINKRSVFSKDETHIYHKLELQGFSETETIILLLTGTIILLIASIVMFALEIRYRYQFAILGLILLFIYCFSLDCTKIITKKYRKWKLKKAVK